MLLITSLESVSMCVDVWGGGRYVCLVYERDGGGVGGLGGWGVAYVQRSRDREGEREREREREREKRSHRVWKKRCKKRRRSVTSSQASFLLDQAPHVCLCVCVCWCVYGVCVLYISSHIATAG